MRRSWRQVRSLRIHGSVCWRFERCQRRVSSEDRIYALKKRTGVSSDVGVSCVDFCVTDSVDLILTESLVFDSEWTRTRIKIKIERKFAGSSHPGWPVLSG